MHNYQSRRGVYTINLSNLNEREQQLARWVTQQLSILQPLSSVQSPHLSNKNASIVLTPIASDAGFRRYFRFATPSQWLAVDAPPETEDSRQFVALASYLDHHGVGTPHILAADETQGFLLVEDFGDDLLYRQLNTHTATALYGKALDTLLDLQRCPDNAALIPRYDQALLHRELLIFSEWFVTALLQHPLSPAENTMLEQIFKTLEDSALAQPQTLVHRDYHSRNLLLRTDAGIATGLGVIDFQGALWGPCTYDLVSLLRDCYLRWPAAQVKQWALNYRQQVLKAGLLNDVSETEFLRWFDWIGLQRHIKVLGIFARLSLRDGKQHYLCDLPLVIRYTLEVARTYPEFHTFTDWFTTTLLPLAEQQAWYTDYRHAGDNP